MSFWPSGYSGAISLTFDDGLPSQLAMAVPQLTAHGLRGTFYIDPHGSETGAQKKPSWRERLDSWLPAHEAGHEIGNHSLSHPCSLNVQVTWVYSLSTVSRKDICRLATPTSSNYSIILFAARRFGRRPSPRWRNTSTAKPGSDGNHKQKEVVNHSKQ